MTLRHFKVFLVVYTERNMTAAAKKLYMTQPSVSQTIKELENHYNVVLFERFPKALMPTPSGDVLFEYATNILEMNNELDDLMKQGSSQHILRIGANDTAGLTLLDELIITYSKLNPSEEVRVVINRSALLVEMLKNNDVDVIITDEFQISPDLESRIIGKDSFIFVASPEYKPLPKDNMANAGFLSNSRLLLREPGCEQRNYLDNFLKESGVSVTPFWESISYDILVNAALNGMGITLLPRNKVTEYLNNGSLIEIKVPGFDSRQEFVLSWPKSKYLSTPIDNFINLCLKKGA
ncbi:MAG: LysR family transcriptional regulator [Lachnospiraceae bacterium]|nr:LysR family transcriptional regulator [Lachnospiraceae bacterium]